MHPEFSRLVNEWRTRPANLRRWAGSSAEGAASAYELAAAELEAALEQIDNEILTLAEAADASGYTADHLGRLVRGGTIPNAGRPNAPRVRRGDLPLKAGTLPPPAGPIKVDRTQIARSVINSESGAR